MASPSQPDVEEFDLVVLGSGPAGEKAAEAYKYAAYDALRDLEG